MCWTMLYPYGIKYSRIIIISPYWEICHVCICILKMCLSFFTLRFAYMQFFFDCLFSSENTMSFEKFVFPLFYICLEMIRSIHLQIFGMLMCSRWRLYKAIPDLMKVHKKTWNFSQVDSQHKTIAMRNFNRCYMFPINTTTKRSQMCTQISHQPLRTQESRRKKKITSQHNLGAHL
jgi:hypothetical protein